METFGLHRRAQEKSLEPGISFSYKEDLCQRGPEIIARGTHQGGCFRLRKHLGLPMLDLWTQQAKPGRRNAAKKFSGSSVRRRRDRNSPIFGDSSWGTSTQTRDHTGGFRNHNHHSVTAWDYSPNCLAETGVVWARLRQGTMGRRLHRT